MDFESMSETMEADDAGATAEDDAFTEGETESFDDDSDIDEEEGEDDEGYF